jgi:phosphoglycolate phosphatase-like HAD superfamily hydrolase
MGTGFGGDSWLVIYDLDGVWLSEEAYLDAAGLTVASLFASLHPGTGDFHESRIQDAAVLRDVRGVWLPDGLVRMLRARGINSNWDKALAALIAWRCMRDGATAASAPRGAENWLASVPGQGTTFLDALRARVPDFEDMRREVVARFQRFFLGDSQAESSFLRVGLAARESCLVDTAQAAASLRRLAGRGCVLGIGTGRPRAEARRALEAAGLWTYFSSGHVATADEAAREEARLNLPAGSLLKPHPFTFTTARAKWPPERCVVVGDSPADAQAAAAAGLSFIAVGNESDGAWWGEEALAIVSTALEVPDILEDR